MNTKIETCLTFFLCLIFAAQSMQAQQAPTAPTSEEEAAIIRPIPAPPVDETNVSGQQAASPEQAAQTVKPGQAVVGEHTETQQPLRPIPPRPVDEKAEKTAPRQQPPNPQTDAAAGPKSEEQTPIRKIPARPKGEGQ